MSDQNQRRYFIKKYLSSGNLNKQEIIERLSNRHDLDVTERTIERDFQYIRDVFEINITYSRRLGLYEIDRSEQSRDARDKERLLDNIAAAKILESIQVEPAIASIIQFDDDDLENNGHHHIQIIAHAIINRRCLELVDHFNITRRQYQTVIIQPYLIKNANRRWYVDGFCPERNEFRIYGLDRVKAVKVLEQTFIPRQVNRKEVYSDRIGVSGNAIDEFPDPAPVRLRIQGRQAELLKRLPLHSSQQIEESNHNYIVIQLNLLINQELIQYIMSQIEDVKVLAPMALKAKVNDRLSKALANFQA